jgi:hypothetical protein
MLKKSDDFLCVNAQFPRIGQILLDLWGTDGLGAYINRLMQDTRDGERIGFPPDVAKALFKLSREHDERYPAHALKVADIWRLARDSDRRDPYPQGRAERHVW